MSIEKPALQQWLPICAWASGISEKNQKVTNKVGLVAYGVFVVISGFALLLADLIIGRVVSVLLRNSQQTTKSKSVNYGTTPKKSLDGQEKTTKETTPSRISSPENLFLSLKEIEKIRELEGKEIELLEKEWLWEWNCMNSQNEDFWKEKKKTKKEEPASVIPASVVVPLCLLSAKTKRTENPTSVVVRIKTERTGNFKELKLEIRKRTEKGKEVEDLVFKEVCDNYPQFLPFCSHGVNSKFFELIQKQLNNVYYLATFSPNKNKEGKFQKDKTTYWLREDVDFVEQAFGKDGKNCFIDIDIPSRSIVVKQIVRFYSQNKSSAKKSQEIFFIKCSFSFEKKPSRIFVSFFEIPLEVNTLDSY